MNEISFIHSPYWLIPAALVAGAMVYVLYFRSNKYSPRQRLLLGAFRFLSILALSVLLLRPVFISTKIEEQKPELIWLQDASKSTQVNEEVDQNYALEKEKLFNSLGDKYRIKEFLFSDRLYVDSVEFKGITNLDRSLQELKRLYYNQKVAALVLASDGILNRGRSLQLLQFENAEKIYSLKLGEADQKPSLEILDLRFNPEVLLGRKFQLEFDLSGTNLSAQNLLLQLKDNQGNLLSESRYESSGNAWHESGAIEIEGSKEGVNSFTLELSAENGLKASKRFSIKVQEDKIETIVYTKESHPDIAAITRALMQDPLISINYTQDLNELEDSKADLIISTESSPEFLSVLESKAWPHILLLSAKSKKGGYLKTVMGSEDFESEKQYADWNPNFSLFPVSKEQESLWEEFPPLDGIYGPSQLPDAANILFYKRLDNLRTKEGLVFLSDDSFGVRACVFLGRGLWRWRLHNYRLEGNFDAFDGFIANLSQYLLAQEKKAPLRLIWEKEIIEGLSTKVQAKLYDKSGNLINNKNLELSLFRDGEEAYQYILNPYRNIYQQKLMDLKAGLYRYTAEVDLGGELIYDRGTLEVLPNDLEDQNRKANHEGLDTWAISNGGDAYSLKDLSSLQDELIQQNFSGQLIEQRNKEEILSRWPLFFVFLGLFAFEWFLRKYWGQY